MDLNVVVLSLNVIQCGVKRDYTDCVQTGHTKTEPNIGKKQKHFICDTTRKLSNLSMNTQNCHCMRFKFHNIASTQWPFGSYSVFFSFIIFC